MNKKKDEGLFGFLHLSNFILIFARKPTSLQLVGGIANSVIFINYYYNIL